MDEFYDRDSLEPNVTDTTYRNHDIKDESDIFEPENIPVYEEPKKTESVSDYSRPQYAYNFSEQEDSSVEHAVGDEQPEPRTVFMEDIQTSVYSSGTQRTQSFSTIETPEQHASSKNVQEQRFSPEEPQAQHLSDEELKSQQIDMREQKNDHKKPAGHMPGKKNAKKKSGFGRKLLKCAALAVVFGLISGGVFLAVAKVGGNLLGINNNSQAPVIGMVGSNNENSDAENVAGTVSDSSGNYTVAQVAERCMPAMVAITNKSIQEIPNYFGFGSQNYESENSGSGIIVGQTETELLIATNNHVVSGADTLTVCFVDDELVDAIIKGTDAENDLAVISVQLEKIPEETLSKIKVIEIGDSDELVVGDQVVAIGNALGYGQSVSAGYISALNRQVTIDSTTYTLLQTDAAINPGNSGGALLNMKGQLIGINESKYADTAVEGMGYAIPISTATPILSKLMSRETRYKVDEENASYIGISCKDISSEFAEMYNVPIGVYVDSVVENGPAATAGLQKGDIITKFADTTVSSYSELIAMLEYYAAGEIVDITYYRTDKGIYTEQTTSLVLGAKSESDIAQSQSGDTQSQGNAYDNSQYYENPKEFDLFDFFGY